MVGVDGGDPVRGGGRGGEVGEVERHDHLGPRLDGGRQDVVIVLVGQGQRRDPRLVASDLGLRDRPHQLGTGQVGAIGQEVAGPFLVDGVGPAGADQANAGQVEQQVAERGRVEDAGIVDGADRLRISSPAPAPGPGRPTPPGP
jgi:hypothetical protein